MGFALFFFLRLVGGLLHRRTAYPARQDAVFTIPIVAAVALLALAGRLFSQATLDASYFFCSDLAFDNPNLVVGRCATDDPRLKEK